MDQGELSYEGFLIGIGYSQEQATALLIEHNLAVADEEEHPIEDSIETAAAEVDTEGEGEGFVPDPEPEVETEAEVGAEGEAGAEAEADTEDGGEGEASADPEPESEVEVEVEAEVDPEASVALGSSSIGDSTAEEIPLSVREFARSAIILRQHLGPRPSSSSTVAEPEGPPLRGRSRSPQPKARPKVRPRTVRPPLAPQPLRPVTAAVQDCYRVYSFDSTSFRWLEQPRVSLIPRPASRHLACDFNWVLNTDSYGRRVQPGAPLPQENLEVIWRLAQSNPIDRTIVLSQVENPSLIRSLLDSAYATSGLNDLIDIIVTCPRKTGPRGKAQFLTEISGGSLPDWVLVDDNAETVNEVVHRGGSAVHVFYPKREFANSSIPWARSFAGAEVAIRDLKKERVFL